MKTAVAIVTPKFDFFNHGVSNFIDVKTVLSTQKLGRKKNSFLQNLCTIVYRQNSNCETIADRKIFKIGSRLSNKSMEYING